ncbi:MAG: HYR domain-containing protein [Saprospiraceae bacterium]
MLPQLAKASDGALNPVICPYNVTVSCTAYTWDPADYGSPIPTGGYNPTIVGPTIYSNVNSCGVGTITRTWQIYLYNSTYTCTQVITITGNYNQVQIQWPPDYTINGCNGSTDPNNMPAPYNKPKVTNQGCSHIGIAYKDCVFTTENGCKMILRKWTVIDWCVYQTNNPYTYGIWEKTQVIKIQDVKAPTIVCPYDVTASVSDGSCSGGYVNIPVPQAYDDCGTTSISHNSVYAYSQGSNASGYYPVGTTLVTFTAKDGCNNTAKCIMKVTVKDGKPPLAYVHHGLAATLMNMNGGMVQLTGQMFDAGSTDNCTPQNQLIFNLYPNLFTCDDLGYNEVTVTVTDKSGNTSTVKTYVIIQDNQGFCPPDTTDPTISCYNIVAFLPKDSCGSLKVIVPKPVATDNRKVTVTNNSPYATSNGIDATGIYPQGTTLIKFIAADAAGNTAECVSSVTVKDTFAPVVTCKNGYQLPLTDNAGNIGATLVATNLVKTLTDNCTSGAQMIYNVTPSAFTCDDIGEKEVTLTVTDQSGNSDFCITTITITDPDNKCGTGVIALIDCPGDIVLEVPADSCLGGQVNMANATINDTLAVATVANNSIYATESGANASGYYPLGTTEVIFTATDTAGGIYSCVAKITVKEPESPSLVCKNGTSINLVLGANGDATATVDAASLVKLVMDNCTPANQIIFSAVPAVLNCDDLGPDAMIKIYGEDASGNKDFCLALVNVTDTADICGTLKNQELMCPKDITVILTGANACGNANIQLVYPVTGSVKSVTNSSAFSSGHGADASGAYPIGTTVVNFVVIQENGNVINCPVKVIVKETTPPVAICRHDVQIKMGKNLSGGGFGIVLPAMINRGSYDNCTAASDLQMSVSPAYFNCSQLGLQRVKLTVKDKSGNTDYCYTYVNVTDPDVFCGSTLIAADGGNTTYSDEDAAEYVSMSEQIEIKADQAKLFQNAPNPFRSQTVIRFYLPTAQQAKITLYDMTGSKIKTITDNYEAGTSELTIDRRDLSIAGFYLVHLETATQSESIKMILVD